MNKRTNSNIKALENKGILNWVEQYLNHFYSCGVLPHEIINNSYVTSSISDLVSSSLADLKEKNTLHLDILPEIKEFLYHSDTLGFLEYVKNVEYPILELKSNEPVNFDESVKSDESDYIMEIPVSVPSKNYSGGLKKSNSSVKKKLGPGFRDSIPSSRKLYK